MYSDLEYALLGALVLATVITFVVILRLAAKREKRDRVILEASLRDKAHRPASLHPLIDSDVCIGSMTCISACPEGNVLGMIEGSSALIKGANCIGHGRCAVECPVDAITLVMGDTERGVDLPHLDRSFQSSRKGVYVIGELAGMGLIKNAVRQGVLVMDELQKQLLPEYHDADVDIVVVGAGPAGLTAAVAARAAKLSCLVLEQSDAIGGTITTYHRHKLVTSEPVKVPLYGTIHRGQMTKEEALELWQDIARRTRITVSLGQQVETIDGTDGHFVVRTARGVTTARKIILATGIRGTPMRLGVPGENAPHVAYRLADAWQYVGRRVLVVGGGDSALEAVAALAEAGAEVAISYRRGKFARARAQNLKKVEDLVASGRAQALFHTRVASITANTVLLEDTGRTPGATTRFRAEFVLVCAGGSSPAQFLGNLGITLEEFKGEAPPALSHLANPSKKSVLLPYALGLIGIATAFALAYVGWDYYRLPRALRYDSPLHASFRPAGSWGRSIGMVATAVMMLNFTLAARKRVRILRGVGHIRDWLNFHVFVGVMAPVCIAFHAAFQYENAIAVGTSLAMAVVVLTGIIGRFVYGLVPGGPSGRPAHLAELSDRIEALRRSLASTDLPPSLARLLEAPSQDELPNGLVEAISLPRAIARMALRLFKIRMKLEHYTNVRRDPVVREARADLEKLARLREQFVFYPALKRFMALWRALHVALSLFLVVLIGAHIYVSFLVGFGLE